MAMRKGLGKGLGALIEDFNEQPNAPGEGAVTLPLQKIEPNPLQPRKTFNPEELDSLADSIRMHGIIQPLTVRKLPSGFYQIIAGERRWRAARLAGLSDVPVVIIEADDKKAMELALIENLQRSDLNPIEEARGILNMMENFHLTQEAASQRLGKPRSSIANSLRLLKLPEEIRGYISKGLLSLGHAKVIMGVDDPVRQTILARKIIEGDLNVRAAEDAVKRMKTAADGISATSPASVVAQNAVIRDIQNRVSSKLNAEVEIKHNQKRGKIIISYVGNDDLQRILDIFGVKI